MKESIICPKCSDKMEKGVTIDKGDYSMATKQQWINQKHWKSKFWGPKSRDKKDIISYACSNCGFIENYIIP
jgi:hypothetical protein